MSMAMPPGVPPSNEGVPNYDPSKFDRNRPLPDKPLPALPGRAAKVLSDTNQPYLLKVIENADKVFLTTREGDSERRTMLLTTVKFKKGVVKSGGETTTTLPEQEVSGKGKGRLPLAGGPAEKKQKAEVSTVTVNSDSSIAGVGTQLKNLIGKVVNSAPVQAFLKLVSTAKEHVSVFFTSKEPKDPKLEARNTYIQNVAKSSKIAIMDEASQPEKYMRPGGEGVIVKKEGHYHLALKDEKGQVSYTDLSTADNTKLLEELIRAKPIRRHLPVDKPPLSQRVDELRALVAEMKPKELKAGEQRRTINLGTVPPGSRRADEAAKVPNPVNRALTELGNRATVSSETILGRIKSVKAGFAEAVRDKSTDVRNQQIKDAALAKGVEVGEEMTITDELLEAEQKSIQDYLKTELEYASEGESRLFLHNGEYWLATRENTTLRDENGKRIEQKVTVVNLTQASPEELQGQLGKIG